MNLTARYAGTHYHPGDLVRASAVGSMDLGIVLNTREQYEECDVLWIEPKIEVYLHCCSLIVDNEFCWSLIARMGGNDGS